MYKQTASFVLMLALTISVYCQDNWNRYAWGTFEREGFAVLLPFVPVQINNADGEQGISASEDEDDAVLFRNSVIAPVKNSLRFNATFQDGVSREEFDNQVSKWMGLIAVNCCGDGTGTDRVTREKETALNREVREISICGFSGIEFGNSNSVQQFYLINNRLYHVWAIGGNRTNPKVAKFLDSFTLVNPWTYWQGARLSPEFTGSGLGSGSGISFEAAVCRDIGQSKLNAEAKQEKPAAKLPTNSPVRIISKPRPAYPEEAKKKGIQGVVALRTSFLSNGTIGTVTLVKGISKEINESAIAAAKLIRFEPEIRNGKPISVTKVVEYSFTIY